MNDETITLFHRWESTLINISKSIINIIPNFCLASNVSVVFFHQIWCFHHFCITVSFRNKHLSFVISYRLCVRIYWQQTFGNLSWGWNQELSLIMCLRVLTFRSTANSWLSTESGGKDNPDNGQKRTKPNTSLRSKNDLH